MWRWIRTLDRILRGEATRLPALRDGKLDVPVWGLAVVIDVLGLLYGLCMGVFSLTPGGSFATARAGSHFPMQVVASMVKVPALFLLTLLVTFPSLYVFNALVGSRLRVGSMLRLLIASLAVMLAVLASVGPIVAFFSFTTTSYPFMILLNVVVFAASGFLGLAFLLQTLHRLTLAHRELHPAHVELPPAVHTATTALEAGLAMKESTAGIVDYADALAPANPEPVPPGPDADGPLDPPTPHVLAPHVRTVFRVWILMFGLVGVQMAWVLRPFIGRPGTPFTWFRAPNSNFFLAVVHAIQAMAG